MRASVVAALTFALGALAAPRALSRRDDGDWCMTDDEATHVAQNFQGLISNYSNAAAELVLCTTFTDYSDSVSELINGGCANGPAPLGQPTFSSLAAFEAGQGSQPNIEFTILKTYNACDAVTIRWRTTSPGTQFVTGIIVAEVVRASGPEPWLIETVYSEFNSGAWLVDLGLVQANCTA